MKSRLFIIGCTGIPARYGGFETFAENISGTLIKDAEITVYCERKVYSKNERRENWNRVHRRFLPIPANGIFSLVYDLISILLSLRTADFILILGTGPGIFMPLFSMMKRVKFITHIDGAEWLRPKWNFFIRNYLFYSSRLSIKYSDYIIIDNNALLNSVPAKHNLKILNMKYGGDHLPETSNDESVHFKPFALVICRAEPENNLQLIANAFKKITHLDLIVISNWSQTRFGRKLVKSYRNSQNILFKDPIYNDPVLMQRFRKQCNIYIHGHSAGGTNPSLVEAMYSGCPVIAYDTAYNKNTTQNLAYYFKTSEELVNHINLLPQTQLLKSGKQMRSYAEKFYTWEKVSLPLRSIL